MPFDQYHEPAQELSEETRTFARLVLSMIEEAEAIDWYEQRAEVETDEEARAVFKLPKRKNLSISEWILNSC